MRYRTLTRLVTPEALPVSLEDFKAHARIDGDADDAYATSLIGLASDYVEDAARRTLLFTRYEMRLDVFPGWRLELPKPPMALALPGGDATVEQVEVEYLNELGQVIPLPSTTYRVDRRETPGSLYPLFNGSWPVGSRDEEGAIRVRWWAGYGPDHTAVPRQIKHLILMLANHWYSNREATSTYAGRPVPLGAESLLAHVSWGQYG